MSPSALLKKARALAPGRMWIVGGYLRDAWLARPSIDVDLAVLGDAEAAARSFAKPLGRKAFTLDKERGIHRVAWRSAEGGACFDFCRLQGGGIREDLARRDFTVNAMALPVEAWAPGWKNKLIDPHDGRRDLAARRLALVHKSALREDPLRLLRAFRLAAELDFSVAGTAVTEIRARRRLILKSAPERIREEILKTLETSRGAAAFRAMDKAGLLSVIFPEVEPMRRTGGDYYGREGVLGHSLNAMAEFEELQRKLKEYFPQFHGLLEGYLAEPISGHPRAALLKLAELLHDVGKPKTAKMREGKLTFYGHDALGGRMAQAAARRLRFSSEESRSLAGLVHSHMRPGNLGHQPELTDRAIYRFYRDLGADGAAMLVVSLADHFTYLSPRAKSGKKDRVFLAIRRMLASFFLKREKVEPPRVIDGHALMKHLNIRPGPVVGRLLAAVREAQAAGLVRGTAEALVLAKKTLASLPIGERSTNPPAKGTAHA